MNDPEPIRNPFSTPVAAGALARAMAAVTDLADEPELQETPEEAQERLDRQRAGRVAMWERNVPVRFREASVRALTPGQDPDGRVTRWWASDAATLVLRSEEPGVGKTYAAYAVGNLVVATQSVWARAWRAAGLLDAIRPDGDSSAYEVARECDLLILDDLGREKVNEWTLERFLEVLDARWASGLRTIVTTNTSGATLLERYGSPIVDRLVDGSWLVPIVGTSRRTVAPW